MSAWIQLSSCPRERMLLSVRHTCEPLPACWVEVLLSRLDGTSGHVVHRGRLAHDHHVGWTVRWLDEATFAVRLAGGGEARYRLDGDRAAQRLTEEERASAGLPGAKTSREWLGYFEHNARHLFDVPWDAPVGETEAIAESIQGFQLGASSEGRHLTACAREYAERTGDEDYVEALKYFIREEQRHARDLARFMERAGIPTIDRTWPDTVFRSLRQFAGLELSISVLITAEIVAKVYYPALREATRSPMLRRVCDRIISDEIQHVEFQSERLAMLRRGRGDAALAATHGLHRFLFGGTLGVVWWKHARALRAGGYGLRRFWSAAWRMFEETRRRMDPRTYRG